jgi:DNA-binding XRE family transcriptional regulator
MQTIRDLRLAKGWTQFTLALKVGVQPQAVYFWEQGKRLPQVRPMRRLGVLFGLCSDDIALVLRGDPTSPPGFTPDRQAEPPIAGSEQEGESPVAATPAVRA